jgi:hypothetical protein
MLSKNKMTLDPYINYATHVNQTQETHEGNPLSNTKVQNHQLGGKYKIKGKSKRSKRRRSLKTKPKRKFKKTNKRTYRKKN